MNYRWLTLILILILVPGTLWSTAQRRQANFLPGMPENLHDLVAPQESLIEAASPHHYAIKGPQGNVNGYIFFTAEMAKDVQGYGGRIPMIVRIDPRGGIRMIKLLPNNETPSYTGDLNILLRRFIGKKPSDPLELNNDIDAISGATISSTAVTRTIRQSLRNFSGQVLSTAASSSPSAQKTPWLHVIAALAVFSICLTAIITARSKLRWLAMAAGLVYFGLMTATMLSIVQVANLGLLSIPDFLSNPLWWITLVFAFVIALAIGRAHCASVCPFALVQEVLFKVLRRRKAPQIDSILDRRARYLKYFFLFTILASTFVLGNTSTANIEPFITLFRGQGTKLAWTLLIAMLIFAIFHFRFWCVYFCPVGALTGLVSRLSFYKIKLKNDCSRCRHCSAICPVQAITPPSPERPVVVDEAECILCGRCIQGCPENKLALRSRHEKT